MFVQMCVILMEQAKPEIRLQYSARIYFLTLEELFVSWLDKSAYRYDEHVADSHDIEIVQYF